MIVRKSDLIRRAALVLTILISGGSLLFPRLPILCAIVLLYLVARNWVLDVKRQMLFVVILLAAILLVTILRPAGASIESTSIRFANFIAGLLMLDLYMQAGVDAFRRDLYGILHLMAWQALLTVLIAELFNFLFVPLVVAETTYSTFLLLFNYHVMLEDVTSIIRPDGFFYEPGVFQVYLNLFLYLAMFVFRNQWKSVLAAAAVFSTQSTTGVLIGVTIVYVFIATRYLNRGSLRVKVAKVLVACLAIGALGLTAASNIKEKTSGDSQGSYWARQYDLLTGLNVIAANPIFGIGFDYDQYYRASANLGFSDTLLPDRIIRDRGNSNGIVFLLYSIGIPLSIPFFVGMFRQRMLADRTLIGVVLILAFFGESMIFTPFFLMIIFSGLLATRYPFRVPQTLREY